MKNYIIILLLVLIILLIFSRKKYNTRESFLLKKKCLDINNYNGKNNRNCENEIKKTQEIIPVLNYQDYDKYCLINNYKNFYQPKIIGNYKVSLKCEPQLKCACGDNAECMYMKNSDGNINLTKKCKVSSNKMNEMLNSDISKMIKYSKYINKIPEICNQPDLQNGWFYEPGSNLNEIKNIYDENLGINSRCNNANDIIKPIYNKKKNVTLQVNSNIPKPANSVKLNVNTNDNIPKLQPMPIVQEELIQPMPIIQEETIQPIPKSISKPAPTPKQPPTQLPIPQVQKVVVPKYIQVSTKNTSLGKILIKYKYPIKSSYYYLSWSGARPNLGNNRKWAVWTPNKGNEGQLSVNITPDGYLSQKGTNLYLSWSCWRTPNICPKRRWVVWSPNKDTPVEVTSDGYLKMKSKNLYLSWSGYRRNILGAYRLSAVWSPNKDNPIILNV